MKIHEYQAKELFSQYGISIPSGHIAETPDQAEKIAKELGGKLWVIKAQVHAGGRGKAGGVRLARSIPEVRELSEVIVGMTLVSHQTGNEGKKVRKVLVEKGCDIKKEYYLAILLDRAEEKIAAIASSQGGVDIEKVSEKSPDKIFREYADSLEGFHPVQLERLANKLGFIGKTAAQFEQIVSALYKIFVEKDAALLEINPLILTSSGDLMALDAKVNFDDNGLFRHPEIDRLRDFDEEDPREVEASKFNLNYIRLNGEIGCMVNGAGLAMATMDIIKLAGGEPANFLDVGGGASQEKVKEAFKLLLSDKNVKAVLVNIFGGIMRCDVIARGILEAARQIEMNIPLVVRLEGTNVEEGRRLLKESGLKIITASTMKDAAQKAVSASTGGLLR
jgi:succinyl-CoA synthetase beta subunit